NDVVGKFNCAFDARIRGIDEIHIDFAYLVHNPKAARWGIKERYQSLRENVLPGVLLNVIQSTWPVNATLNEITNFGRWTLNDVHDRLAFVHAFHHPSAVQRPGVTGLTAAGGIKRRAVESDGSPPTNSLSDINDAGVKLDQMRVRVIEPFGPGHDV